MHFFLIPYVVSRHSEYNFVILCGALVKKLNKGIISVDK